MIAEGPNGVIANRPDAPYTLTDAEADEWRAIVASMQPDYFQRSHYPMLSQLMQAYRYFESCRAADRDDL
jgi:hypothetical protein